MSALGFVGGLAGAVAIGIYGLIAFVFLTAAMLELADRGRTSRAALFLALAGALVWPVSLVVASAAALHAGRRARQSRQENDACLPSRGHAGSERALSGKPAIAGAEYGTKSGGMHGGLLPDQLQLVRADQSAAEPVTPRAAITPDVSGAPLPVSVGGPVVRTLAPLQMQPQPPLGMPGPDSRSRIILSPRQFLGTAPHGEHKPSSSRHRLRQTSFRKPPAGKSS